MDPTAIQRIRSHPMQESFAMPGVYITCRIAFNLHVRLSRTPWIGECTLNMQSCCLPVHSNGSLIANLPVSTRFYLHLLTQPLCHTENVTVRSAEGELVRRRSAAILTLLQLPFTRLDLYRLSYPERQRIFLRHRSFNVHLPSIAKVTSVEIHHDCHAAEAQDT